MNSTETSLRQRLERLTFAQQRHLAGRLQQPGDPQELVAVVVQDGSVDAASLRPRLAMTLPAHMLPARIHVADRLPRTPNGKVDYAALGTRIGSESLVRPAAARSNAAPKAPPSEGIIAEIWSALLGGAQVSPDDDFFALGGHSFLVLRMVRKIEERTGKRVAPAVVFRFPTVAALARYIDRDSDGVDASELQHVFPLTDPAGVRSRSPFFFSQPEGFRGLLDGALDGARALYGIRGIEPHPDGYDRRWKSMRDLAGEVLAEIRRVQPEPPYAIGGYSFGALVAFEIACLLQQQSLAVERLLIIEPSPQVCFRFGKVPVMLWESPEPVATLSWRRAAWLWVKESHFLRAACYRKLGRLAFKDARRVLRTRVARKRRAAGQEIPMACLKAEAASERMRLYREHCRTPYHGPVTFFGTHTSLARFDRDWAPVLRGENVMVELPGSHLTFLSSEHHALLRQPLRHALLPDAPS